VKIRVEVKLPGADPLVQELEITDEKFDRTVPTMRSPRLRYERNALVRGRIRTIQKRYPTAEVTWREVGEEP
jgi:hypothetical protein